MKSGCSLSLACLAFLLTTCDQRESDDRTPARMLVIINALEQYKEKFGEYPEPTNPSTMGSGNPSSLRIGGALALYQAITGDGDNHILLKMSRGNKSAGTTASDGMIDNAERHRTIKDDLPKDMILATKDGWMLVDTFGHPFQYDHGGNTAVPNVNVVNAGFDIWSIGRAKTKLAPSAPSKLQKQDQTLTTLWIKNW